MDEKVICQFPKKELNDINSFFCDIDGTLVKTGCPLTEKTIDAVKRIKTKIPFFLCSGRNISGILPFYQTLELDTPIISLNGAFLYDPRKEKILFSETLSSEEAEEILLPLKDIKGEALGIHIYRQEKWLVNHPDSPFVTCEEKAVRRKANGVFSFSDFTSINKILLIGPKERCDALMPILTRKHPNLNIIHNYPTYIEIFSSGADKGKAFEVLCSHYGYKEEKALVAGDTAIDLSILHKAGYRAVPMSAEKEIQDCANILIPEAGEDGVAALIEEIEKAF